MKYIYHAYDGPEHLASFTSRRLASLYAGFQGPRVSHINRQLLDINPEFEPQEFDDVAWAAGKMIREKSVDAVIHNGCLLAEIANESYPSANDQPSTAERDANPGGY